MDSPKLLGGVSGLKIMKEKGSTLSSGHSHILGNFSFKKLKICPFLEVTISC